MLTLSHKNKKKKKTHLHLKGFTQDINWMLAENLKPPKRARNSWHNQVEQKKKEREKESGQDSLSWEGAGKEKGNPHPEKQPNKQKDQLSQRDLQDTEESTAAGLRTEKQSERSTDHLNCWHRHHSLRFSGGGLLGTET